MRWGIIISYPWTLCVCVCVCAHTGTLDEGGDGDRGGDRIEGGGES